MRKSISWLFLLSFMVAAMLACGARAQEKTVELTLMITGSASNLDMTEFRMDFFEQKYPGIKVKVEAFTPARIHEFDSLLKVWYASGTAPDVVCVDFELLDHVISGALLPLDEFMKEDEKFQKRKYWHAQQLREFTYAGKIYGVPRPLYTYGFWINCDLFDEAGIGYPKLGWTADDFVVFGQKLTEDLNGDGFIDQFGFNHRGFSHPDHSSFYAYSLGADWWTYDEKTGWVNGSNLKDPRVVENLQWYADLVAKYKISPSPELGDAKALGLTFPLGKLGMTAGATWSIPGYKNSIGDKFRWEFVPNPTAKSGLTPRGVILQRPAGAIMSNCENPEEAWILLREFSGYEQEKIIFDEATYQDYGPLFKDSLILEDWLNQDPPGRESTQLLLDLVTTDYAFWSPDNKFPRGYEEWLAIWRQEMEPVLRGKKTAQEAVDEFFDRANATVVWDKDTQEKIERFLK